MDFSAEITDLSRKNVGHNLHFPIVVSIPKESFTVQSNFLELYQLPRKVLPYKESFTVQGK